MISAGLAIFGALFLALRYYAHKAGGKGSDKMRSTYLWCALACASFAGVFAHDTFVGDLVSAIANMGVLTQWPPVIVMVLGIIKDLWGDREPDKVAPWFIFFLPSWSGGLPGAIGNGLGTMFTAINNAADSLLSNLFGA